MSTISQEPSEDLKFTPEQLNLAEAEWKKVNRHDYIARLQSYSWEHPSLHRKRAMDLHKSEFQGIYDTPPNEIVMNNCLISMYLCRMVWGRSVQPIGDLDDLAPVVGAIRLDASDSASSYLGREVVKALEEGNKSLIGRIRKFSTVPLGDHRNHQVWRAIYEVVVSGDYAPSKLLAKKLKAMVYPMEKKLFPNTKEVKDYVTKQKAERSGVFGNMPDPEDAKAWTTLWKESGANAIIEKATRGKDHIARASGSRKQPR